jgi:hypothetical protein
MTTGVGSYSAETKRRALEREGRDLVKTIIRNQRRGENIMNTVRWALHRYANLPRGIKSLGVKCNVSTEHSDVIVTCNDGTTFKIGFK